MTAKKKGSAKTESRPAPLWPLVTVLVYVAIVHTVDTLAHKRASFGIDWHLLFRWQLRAGPLAGFDLFEFLFWLVIPVAFMLAMRRLEWGYFGFTRWKRFDWTLLAVSAVVGVLAVFTIPLFPSLREHYQSMADYPASLKWAIFRRNLIWNCSWIVGWEFIHRCTMTVFIKERWPRYGWLLIPLAEGAYHLQKPRLEMLGMVAFSLIATQWTLRRNNMLLPLLVHLVIEIGLVAFLLLM